MSRVHTIELEPILASVSEAARLLDCSRQTIYDMIKRGDLAYVELGNGKRVLVKDLKQWVKVNTYNGAMRKVKA